MFVKKFCETRNCDFEICEVWEKGGEGGIALANKVIAAAESEKSEFTLLYPDELPLEEKIHKIAVEIYGADGVVYTQAAKSALQKISRMGYGHLPICMAKTQYSFSDDDTKLGRPTGFDIHIREVYLNAGAGFVVAVTGTVMTMPGLPKKPAANNIDVDENGVITGLF